MQLDHINISTPEDLMETVKDFYCDVFGFREGPRPEIPIPGYWLYPESGDVASIHLIASNDHAPPANSHLDHVAFRVQSLDNIKAVLEQKEIPYREVNLEEIGIHQVVLTDPAGIKLEITLPRR